MPLPSDPHLLALSENLLKQFYALFGEHPGFRPAHAKGVLLKGIFTPSAEAKKFTNAPHILRPSVPVVARFSNSTGVPLLPDNDAHADPRGLAIRFYLAEHEHTDIVAHSADGFPTRTGEEFLEFLRALLASGNVKTSPTPFEKFLSMHPAAKAFVEMPKPAPASLAQETYFGVTALRFINAEGVSRYGRYRIVPEAGVQHLDAATLQSQEPDFLFKELDRRLKTGPVGLDVKVQIADPKDTVDDCTVHWPESRPQIALGKIMLNEVMAEQTDEQRKIIFDPIPRVIGIEPSADPLLELRAAVYLMSGRRRREAHPVSGA
jgi:catalase